MPLLHVSNASPVRAAAAPHAAPRQEALIRRYFPASDADAILTQNTTASWFLHGAANRDLPHALAQRLTNLRGDLLEATTAKAAVRSLVGFIQEVRALRTANGRLGIATSLVGTDFDALNSYHFDAQLQVSCFVREATRLAFQAEGVGPHCHALVSAVPSRRRAALAGPIRPSDAFGQGYKRLAEVILAVAPEVVISSSDSESGALRPRRRRADSDSWETQRHCADSSDGEITSRPQARRRLGLQLPAGSAAALRPTGSPGPTCLPAPQSGSLEALLAAFPPPPSR